jgi:signal transduction histidine kinase
MFAGVAEDRGVVLTVDADAPAIAAGDEGELRRVIGNLLDNAIRFTGTGGSVALRVARDPAGRHVVAEVRDTGRGIAPGHLPHVFDRFFKADTARTHSGPVRGGGLGLAICKSLVEAAGGTIGIESRLGEGTRVFVSLPTAQATETPRSSPSPGSPQPAAALSAVNWSSAPRA